MQPGGEDRRQAIQAGDQRVLGQFFEQFTGAAAQGRCIGDRAATAEQRGDAVEQREVILLVKLATVEDRFRVIEVAQAAAHPESGAAGLRRGIGEFAVGGEQVDAQHRCWREHQVVATRDAAGVGELLHHIRATPAIANQHARMSTDDHPAMRRTVAQPRRHPPADEHRRRTLHDDIRRPVAICRITDARRRQAADQHRRLAARQDRAADMRGIAAPLRAGVVIPQAGGGLPHMW